MIKRVMPYVAKCLSSNQLKEAKRALHKALRLATNKAPKVLVFLRINDPYSYLLIQVLTCFSARFNVQFQFHTVLGHNPSMYPELAMWHDHACKDAVHLATLYQLTPPKITSIINDQALIEQATATLLLAEQSEHYLAIAQQVFEQLWQNQTLDTIIEHNLTAQPLAKQLADNEQLLAKKGHYLAAMLYFEGEWYWGIDRLDHLEQRLIDQHLAYSGSDRQTQFNLTYRDFCSSPNPTNHNINEPLIMYWSARSPYSYLGLERAVRLATHYRIPLIIKPVLPMMMRGMNVPQTKKMYIFHDTKREADKLGLPYGYVADPLGAAVERCYALLSYAEGEEKLIDFLLSFARAVNAEGIRAETDAGLKKIVERCGLSWDVAQQHLTRSQWQEQVNNHLDEMLSLGCWGVPSFRYGAQSFWGQDRLGIIEQLIKNNTSPIQK